MDDVENTTAAELAAQINGTQNEQVATTDEVVISSENAGSTQEERLLAGKYKSVEELESSYLELQRDYTKSRQQRVVPVQQPAVKPATVFDEETEIGISNIVEARLAREKQEQEMESANKFAEKYAEDLKDPILSGVVKGMIRDKNQNGEWADREKILVEAKAMIEARLSPKVESAKKESFDEGQQVARRKEQAGAVGGVSSKTPEVDPSTLSAEEYAEYYGIPRV